VSNLKIAVVCHQGLGSSLWLKIQVEKISTTYHIAADVFQTDLNGLSSTTPQIAIGVAYMEEQLQGLSDSTIIVNNILEDELENKLLENDFIKWHME